MSWFMPAFGRKQAWIIEQLRSDEFPRHKRSAFRQRRQPLYDD